MRSGDNSKASKITSMIAVLISCLAAGGDFGSSDKIITR